MTTQVWQHTSKTKTKTTKRWLPVLALSLIDMIHLEEPDTGTTSQLIILYEKVMKEKAAERQRGEGQTEEKELRACSLQRFHWRTRVANGRNMRCRGKEIVPDPGVEKLWSGQARLIQCFVVLAKTASNSSLLEVGGQCYLVSILDNARRQSVWRS